jgi:hypothetical protein
MATPDRRPHALRSAEAAVTAWAETVELQQQATPEHADFYALAAEMVVALHALDDLSVLLARQVGVYGQGRVLYDDTRTTDPADRLAEAVACLRGMRTGLVTTTAAANEFWKAIGPIGVEVAR